jgi:hypothetical protein
MAVRLSALRTSRTLLPRNIISFCVSGTHLYYRLSKLQGLVGTPARSLYNNNQCLGLPTASSGASSWLNMQPISWATPGAKGARSNIFLWASHSTVFGYMLHPMTCTTCRSLPTFSCFVLCTLAIKTMSWVRQMYLIPFKSLRLNFATSLHGCFS